MSFIEKMIKKLLILIVGMFLLVPLAFAVPDNANLSLCWSMDDADTEGVYLKDGVDSPTNNATLSGTVNTGGVGWLAEAYDASGGAANDHIKMDVNQNINFGDSDFTVVFIAEKQNDGTDWQNLIFYGGYRASNSAEGWGIVLEGSTEGHHWNLDAGTNGCNTQRRTASSEAWDNGDWHINVIRRNGTSLDLLVNKSGGGVLDKIVTHSYTGVMCYPTGEHLAISAYEWHQGNWNGDWVGKWDQLMIYKKFLTNDEIISINTERPSCAELVAGPLDTTPPTIDTTSQNNTAPKFDEVVQIGNKLTDETGISSMWYANNATGVLFNVSSINISGLITTLNYTVNITNELGRGNVVQHIFTGNDTSGNSVQSSSVTYSAANYVSVPTIISPIANDYNNTNNDYPIEVTYPEDIDGDSITISYYINGKINNTGTSNYTFNASDGYYILNISLYDGVEHSANVTTNFTIDSIYPVLSFNLTNNTIFGFNVNATVNITIQDSNPFLLQYNWHNAILPNIQNLSNNTPSSPTTISIVDKLNLTGLASGNYTMDINFSDRHTNNKIKDYDHDENAKGFIFNTVEGNIVEITDETLNPNMLKRIIYKIIDNPKIQAIKKNDRYTLEFGKKTKKETRVFRVYSDNPIAIIDESIYKAHLVISNGINGNWVDFENGDDTSTAWVERISSNEVLVYVTSKDFDFNSIGGLNVVNVFYTFQVDNDPPTFPFQSISDTTPAPSTIVTLAHTCQDIIGISTCILAHNHSGTWRNVTNTTANNDITNSINQSFPLTVTADGQVVGTMACGNDTFNQFSCSEAFTLTIDDTISPIINGTLNATRFFVNSTINASFNVSDTLALDTGQVIITEDDITRIFNFSLSGTSDTFSQNFTIKTNPGNSINITGKVIDNSLNFETNETIIKVTRDMLISVTNTYDNTTINSFTATIFNSSFAETKSTTTGLLNFTDIISGNYDFHINSTENGGYFNKTISNVNGSTNLKTDLFQAVLNLFAELRGTAINISNYNITALNIANQSNDDKALTLFLNATQTDFTAFSNSYYATNFQLNLTNTSNNTKTIEFHDINVSISVFSIANGTFIKNFTIALTGTDFSETLTDANEGKVTFNLGNNTYPITVTHPAHVTTPFSFTINSLVNLPNLTFSLAGFNSINFSIFDEVTNDLLPEKATILIIGTQIVRNLSTDNGLLYVQDLAAEEYRITYDSEKFRKRDHYITVTNNSNNTVKLYLLSTGNGTEVTFTVQDNSGNRLENALIKLKRYFIESNSYKVVTMSNTNTEGRSVIDVDFNDAFYETLTTFGDSSLSTIGAKMITTTFILTLKLLEDPFTVIDGIADTVSTLNYNNFTKTFRYTYDVRSGVERTAKLEVSKITPVDEVIVCEATDTSSSGTILCFVNVTDDLGSYRAKSFIEIGDTSVLDKVVEITTGTAKQFKEIFGTQGIFFSILVAGTFGALGAAVSATVGILMFLVGLAMVAIMGFSFMSIIVYITFLLIGIALIYKMKT